MSQGATSSRCPTCRKPTVPEHRPFCSKRCADIDLARWLQGTFVIVGAPLELADDSSALAGSEDGGNQAKETGDKE